MDDIFDNGSIFLEYDPIYNIQETNHVSIEQNQTNKNNHHNNNNNRNNDYNDMFMPSIEEEKNDKPISKSILQSKPI